jgi:hypothetical protein
MEITCDSSNQLTVRGGLPAWLGVFVLIPMFLGAVILTIWQPTTLTCVRGSDCNLESSGLFGSKSEQFKAASLRRANLEVIVTRKRNLIYRVVLDVNGESKPLTSDYNADRAEMAGEVNLINDFVAGKGGQRLVVERDDSWLIVLGLVFGAVSLCLSYFIPRRYLTVIDGHGREIRHRAKWLGFGRERRVPFGDLTGIEANSFGTINGRPWMRAVLKTSGRRLVLGHGPEGEISEQVTRIRAIVHPTSADE